MEVPEETQTPVKPESISPGDPAVGEGYDKTHNGNNGRNYHCYNQYISNGEVISYSGTTIHGSDWSSDIGYYGCSLVSMTTILSGHGISANPGQVASEVEDVMRQYALGSPEQIQAEFQYYGFDTSLEVNYRDNYDSVQSSIEKLRTHLQNGGEAACLSSYGQSRYEDGSYGYSTGAGHWVSVIDISDDGNSVYISDPAGNDGWSNIEDVFNIGGTQTGWYVLAKKD